MKKILLPALVSVVVLPSTAMSATHYLNDSSGIIFEQGAADGEHIDITKETGVIGFVDVEVFKVTVPVKKLDKFKKHIDDAITETTSKQFYQHSDKLSTDHKHLGDATLGNGMRSGYFIGLMNDHNYDSVNLFKGDNAFTKLPASFNEENKKGAIIDEGIDDKLNGFSFYVKSMKSKRNDPSKTVSYDFVTKSNTYNDKWQTDSYKFDITPGNQKFVYTMPNVDANYKGKINVYVYAVYPFVMEKYYQ